jgi:glucose-1-phosphate thymidylyltransferase
MLMNKRFLKNICFDAVIWSMMYVCLFMQNSIFAKYAENALSFLGVFSGVIGDNIFYGHGLTKLLAQSVANVKDNNATVFGYYVSDPERYGVAEFNEDGNVISIEEKPTEPKSNYAVVGLYFYPNDVVQKAKEVKPSERGELEITTLNEMYLKENRLKVELMGRGYAWLDTGTHESLLEASSFIQTIENRQSLKVACLEEIAYEMGYISKEKLLELAEPLKKNQYGQYLLKRANQPRKVI